MACKNQNEVTGGVLNLTPLGAIKDVRPFTRMTSVEWAVLKRVSGIAVPTANSVVRRLGAFPPALVTASGIRASLSWMLFAPSCCMAGYLSRLI